MATKNSNQPAPLATDGKQQPSQSIEFLHQHAVSVLDEIANEGDKVFSIAAAGRAYAGERDSIGMQIFSVIEELCEDTTLTSTLRKLVNELAVRAGSTWAKEVAA